MKDIRYRVKTIFVDMGSLGIYFCACSCIGDDQSYARWWSDRATVLQNNVSVINGGRPVNMHLITEPTHPGTLWLLHDIEPAIIISMTSKCGRKHAER